MWWKSSKSKRGKWTTTSGLTRERQNNNLCELEKRKRPAIASSMMCWVDVVDGLVWVIAGQNARDCFTFCSRCDRELLRMKWFVIVCWKLSDGNEKDHTIRRRCFCRCSCSYGNFCTEMLSEQSLSSPNDGGRPTMAYACVSVCDSWKVTNSFAFLSTTPPPVLVSLHP